MIEKRTLSGGGTRWKARVKAGGVVVAQRTFVKKSDAETWEREQKRALQLGTFLPPAASRHRVSDVAAAFMRDRESHVAPHTLRTDRDNLAALPATFLARPIGAVTAAHVLDVFTDQLKQKQHSTVARLKTTLSSLFTYAVNQKHIAANPVRGVRLPAGSVQKAADDWFTAVTLRATLDVIADKREHYSMIVEFLSLTGTRWGELRALRVSDLRAEPFPAVHVTKSHSDGYPEKATKNHRRRFIPLTDRAAEIADLFATTKRPSAYLFTTAQGRQLKATRFRAQTNWTKSSGGAGCTCSATMPRRRGCWRGSPSIRSPHGLGTTPALRSRSTPMFSVTSKTHGR